MRVVQMNGSAWISNDGLYRYELIREWDKGNGSVLWIMLNPSTADAFNDDPTIRRVVGFTHRWGFSRAIAVNLYSYRATDARELLKVDDPIGPETDAVIRRRVQTAEKIIAAWGTVNPGELRRRLRVHERARYVLDELIDWPVESLGSTSLGHPRHPLYMKADTEPSAYGGPFVDAEASP